MNAILAKLEQKFEAAASQASIVDCLDGDLSRGRGEAADQGNDRGNQRIPTAMVSDWKESEPVVLLSQFMAEYRAQVFYLCQDGAGTPVLHMEPGVTPAAPERWELACQAVDLLAEANEDLVHLLGIGALVLKQMKGNGK